MTTNMVIICLVILTITTDMIITIPTNGQKMIQDRRKSVSPWHLRPPVASSLHIIILIIITCSQIYSVISYNRNNAIDSNRNLSLFATNIICHNQFSPARSLCYHDELPLSSPTKFQQDERLATPWHEECKVLISDTSSPNPPIVSILLKKTSNSRYSSALISAFRTL